MDGDLKTFVRPEEDRHDAVARERVEAAPARPRRKLVRWFVIVGVLLALVLGGLYGFNRFRDQAIKNFFANNKPPPAQVAAVKATSETVPRSASGIGSLAAVLGVHGFRARPCGPSRNDRAVCYIQTDPVPPPPCRRAWPKSRYDYKLARRSGLGPATDPRQAGRHNPRLCKPERLLNSAGNPQPATR